jgi:hypothetical protein
MGVWQGVATDSLKFYLGLLCPTVLRPPRVARPQGEWPAAVFYPFEHPTLYAYVWHAWGQTKSIHDLSLFYGSF